MFLDPRLWQLTRGVRARIAFAVLVGVAAATVGVARLALLGWLLGRVYGGATLHELIAPAAAIAVVMVLRGLLEHLRAVWAHETAARVQLALRERLFEHVTRLGPAHFGLSRTGDALLAMVEGVEQLETYFGRFLPQLFVAAITPLAVCALLALFDLPLAALLLVCAWLTWLAPSLFQKWDSASSLRRRDAYKAFASEFLDAIQGLATLKAFGQSRARGRLLAEKAHEVFRSTMWVLATNSLTRGITDTGIAVGAAAVLAVGAWRVQSGAMPIEVLLMVLMAGVEAFRPQRDLRTLLHDGMVGLSAAQGIFELLEAKPAIVWAGGEQRLGAGQHAGGEQRIENQPLTGGPQSAGGEQRIEHQPLTGGPRPAGGEEHSENQPLTGGPQSAGGEQRIEHQPLTGGPRPTGDASVAFEQVGFAYPGGRAAAHVGLDFCVADGERVGFVGASGAGKSTIVKLLLRFHDPDTGTVRVGGRDLRELTPDALYRNVAVVSQDTYLFHGTVEQNLRFGRPDATQEELEHAARLANAHEFIRRLPQGYRTVIGERGIRLSGGQRQRVAIARALLRDAPILVLDEALSAVDAENEAVIQEALDRLMQGRTTLVFAHRLSSVIDCHRILVLDAGAVVEQGSHRELLAARGHYHALMGSQVEQPGGGVPDLLAPARGQTVEEGVAVVHGPAPADDILRAEGLGWGGVIAELTRYVRPWKGRLALTFAFGVSRVLAFIGVGLLSALAVAAVKQGEPFAHWLWALAVLAPLAGVLHWLESWVAHDMAFRMLAQMRVALFAKLDALAPAFLVRRRSGDLVAMATHDVELVEYFFAHTVAPAFVAVLVPALALAVLWHFGPPLALALAPFLLVVAASPFLFRRRIDELGSRSRESLADLNAFVVDSVQGLHEMLAFQQEARRAQEFSDAVRRHLAVRRPFFRHLSWQTAALEVATGLGGLAIVVTGAWLVQTGSLPAALLPLLTLLALASFLPVSEIAHVGRQLADTLGATRRLYAVAHHPVAVRDGPGVALGAPAGTAAGPALEISPGSSAVPAPDTSAGSVVVPVPDASAGSVAVPVPDAPAGSVAVPVPDAPAGSVAVPVPDASAGSVAVPVPGAPASSVAVPVPDTSPGSVAVPAPGTSPGGTTVPALAMERVSFRYEGQQVDALADASFEVPAGATVALVGPSGAGKTTAAHLFLRFWDPRDGRVLMRGHDLRDFELDDLRARIALVSQDTHLFHQSLEANIRMARPDACDDDVAQALRRAALSDFVASLPEGLATPVGERGMRLSGGQRQRVAIARAFLKDAPVLILDEATSHLDAVSEAAVRAAMEDLMSHRTTLVIAHRLSTVRNADSIVVLDRGRVAEIGDHHTLLARRGLYRQLVSRQLASAAE